MDPPLQVAVNVSFIDGLGTDDEDTAIVEAIIRMAGALGLEVVAEGLETQQQLEEIRRLGCHRVQGFVVSPPLLRREVEGFLRRAACSECRDHARLKPGDDPC